MYVYSGGLYGIRPQNTLLSQNRNWLTISYSLEQFWFLGLTFTTRVPSQSICRSAPLPGVHVLSLVSTFWHRCFTCLYVLTQMFHLSPISRAHVFSPVTTMSHMLLYLLPRTGTHLVSRHYARDPSGKMYPPEKKYILYCQPHFLLECKAMHSVKSAPKFKKYQEFTYAVYGHMFLWNIGINIPAYRSHKHSHSTTLISINTKNPYNWNSRVPLIVTGNIQDSIA